MEDAANAMRRQMRLFERERFLAQPQAEEIWRYRAYNVTFKLLCLEKVFLKLLKARCVQVSKVVVQGLAPRAKGQEVITMWNFRLIKAVAGIEFRETWLTEGAMTNE